MIDYFALTDLQQNQARGRVQYAIKTGRLIRQPCWCGDRGQGHHEDYTKPLDVVWLCALHHKRRHKDREIEIGMAALEAVRQRRLARASPTTA